MRHRILHILPALDTGGAERALARLLAGGLADAFDSHVVSMRGDGAMRSALIDAGAEVHLVGDRGIARLPAELLRLGRRLAPNLVQGWMYHANVAATGLAPLLRPSATLWNIRQGLDDLSGDKPLTRLMIRAGRFLSAHPSRIIYNAVRSADQHEAFGYRADKTLVIPNGFETADIRPDPGLRTRRRAKLGIPAHAPLFVHVARYHPMKDHAQFVAAAGAVLDTVPDARFLMIGRGVDTHAEELLAHLAPAKRTSFTMRGESKDVISFLQAADALVVSSRRAEGFPNVIGEAMMTATAVIATDTGDCRQIVAAGGIIVPPSDLPSLTMAMDGLARDPERAAAIGAAGRARVESDFTIESAAATYRALYHGLLKGVPEPCAV